MSTTSVNNNTTTQATVGANSTNTLDRTMLGEDDFLKILITQMQNQDPTQPMDDKETIAQMAQFTAVEQMTKLNESFTNFAAAQSVGTLSGLIGKNISWTDTVTTGTGDNATTVSTPKEGIVTAISMKDNKAQAVLQDGSKVDVKNIETISLPQSGTSGGV
ncbi:flagellar hook assembly protein FlgD [Aneurinibacillus terranovensis]|uniref:flagellar hook assembly protein FlgD n=1 Tax=Aneurinibacillus terranovensis TaxID=278991 RepID=UPI000401E3EF|nr:flagellar hook assembly protein FlgD [Aneurinibacillus terranovensis]